MMEILPVFRTDVWVTSHKKTEQDTAKFKYYFRLWLRRLNVEFVGDFTTVQRQEKGAFELIQLRDPLISPFPSTA